MRVIPRGGAAKGLGTRGLRVIGQPRREGRVRVVVVELIPFRIRGPPTCKVVEAILPAKPPSGSARR